MRQTRVCGDRGPVARESSGNLEDGVSAGLSRVFPNPIRLPSLVPWVVTVYFGPDVHGIVDLFACLHVHNGAHHQWRLNEPPARGTTPQWTCGA